MVTTNQVQLITYADRLAGDIPRLTALLRSEPFASAFRGVHILPFFTPYDGADAGFDPTDHTQVDPRLGTWDDIGDLSRTHEVMVDLIVNHVSSESEAFQDVVARGDASPHSDLFLTLSSVFPDGATEEQLARIYRPRPGLSFTAMRLGGERRLVWTTFTPQQIDIDVHSASGAAYLESILDAVGGAGVTLVRLDAVGYAVKTPGTSCFMTQESYDFIGEFTEKARARGIEVLVEVHSYYKRQVEIASRVDMVYDFALPPLVLHALYTGDGEALVKWMRDRPRNTVTVLDTHDGIGVIDVGADQELGPEKAPGLLRQDQVDELVSGIHERSANTSAQATGAAASNLDLYQVNCTFYDALGRDDRAYLAARAIQLFTPGIPQIYYVGALAGGNDMDLLERTGVGRDINRHYYANGEVAEQLDRPVVKALMALCTLRNDFPAFDGDVDASLEGTVLTLRRVGVAVPDAVAELTVDLESGAGSIELLRGGNAHTLEDLLGAHGFVAS